MINWVVILVVASFQCFAAETTPTVQVHQSIHFWDDLDFSNLDLAIDRQLASYQRRGLSGEISFGNKLYHKRVLKESLILLKQLAQEFRECQELQTHSEDRLPTKDICLNTFNRKVNEKFAIYRPVPKKSEAGYHLPQTTKFTSYYSPDLTGSRFPTPRFNRAIYRKPVEESLQNFTRVEIDYHQALANKGYEIFWVEDSFFDLYLLHVQGGGRINIHNPDGTTTVKYLSYDGKNNRSFKMIYHYLIGKGYLSPENGTVPNQRKFLQENPDKEEEVFSSCPSYIYFKESDEEPIGRDDISLTENRSLALDYRIYKTTGLINFVKTKKASHIDENGKVVKVDFSRFFIAQDTGGAIKGNARSDLYFGYGPVAEMTAYSMNDMGEQYFLVKK